jgi:hypothetical protein
LALSEVVSVACALESRGWRWPMLPAIYTTGHVISPTTTIYSTY